MPHKVMHILSIADGGMYRHVFDLARGLNRQEFLPVIVASRHNTWLNKPLSRDLRVIPLDVCQRRNPLLPTRDLRKLIYLLRAEKVRILHVHGFRAALWGRVAAIMAGIPVVIYTVHNFPVNKAAIAYGIDRILGKWTTYIITVSGALQEALIGRGIPAGKVITIHNGVKVAKAPRVRIKNKPGKYYNIGIVGRLVELKGIEYFLQAAAAVVALEPRARFYIIGDGPQRSYLQVLAHNLFLSDVLFFTGRVGNLDMWWQSLDILVSCSLQEGLGLGILEAMAASIPVIGTRVGGVPEIIADRVNGILLEPGNSDALASAILELLEDPEWGFELGKRGREVVVQKFNLEKMIRAVENLYHQSLEDTLGQANS